MSRLFLSAGLFAVCLAGSVSFSHAQNANDTPKAAATRKLLKTTKVSVDYKDTTLRDIIDDLKDQVKENAKRSIGVRLDNKGGVSNNSKLSYKADNKTLEQVLDEMFKKNDLGYIVISQQGNAYDGTLLIVKGKARGYPEKKD